MAAQVRKAQAHQKKQARRRYIARSEARREAKAEAWRARFRKPGASPFMRLPGMSGPSATSARKQPVISADARRQAGMASRGSPTSLTLELAAHILELRAEGLSYQEIGERTGHPATTIRHWTVSGRAAAVSEDRGQTN